MTTVRRPKVVLLTACAVFACGHSPPVNGERTGTLVVDGSSSLYPFVKAAADVYHGHHAGVTFDIKKNGSGVGIKRLAERGDLSFANASRPVEMVELDEGEKHGHRLHTTVVAAEAVAVVVHQDNPIASISLADLKAIYFTGEKTDWSMIAGSGRVGPIHVVALDPKISGTGAMFSEKVGGHGKHYLGGAQVVPDDPDVPAVVAADPNAIAFCSQATTGANLRVLKVDGIQPSEQTVLDSSYPLSRRLFVLTDGAPHGLTADFVLFLLSEPGQLIARARGFTPVTLEVPL